MGLLDSILGSTNPIAQWADQNKPTLNAIGAGLGTGTNFGQGLGIGAQLIPQYQQQQREYDLQNTAQKSQLDQIQYDRTLQQNALQLAAQGRNATADWATSQGYGPAVVAAIKTGAISAPDLFKRTAVAPGSVSVLDIPPDGPPTSGPQGGAGGPPALGPTTQTPSAGLPPLQTAPVSGAPMPQAAPIAPAIPVASSPLNPPTVGDRVQQAFASGRVGQGPPALPIPTAAPAQPMPASSVLPSPNSVPTPMAAPQSVPQVPSGLTGVAAAAAPPIPAPTQPVYPRGTITNGATNPLDMTPPQRQALGKQYGLSGAALTAFVVSGKIPAGLADSIGMGTSDYSAGSPPVAVDPITNAPDPASQAAFLKTLDPTTAAVVKSVGDYKSDLTKVTSNRTGSQRAQLLSLITQYNPNFDMAAFPARLALQRSLTSGQMGNALTSVNTTIQHLGDLQAIADQLHNTPFPLWNSISNAAKSNSGQSAPAVFHQTAEAVAQEAAKVFKGTGTTDVGSIESWKSGLSPDMSPDQIHDSIQNLVGNLLKARLDSVQDQYKATMGGGVLPGFLTPASRETLTKLGLDPSLLDPNSPSLQNNASSASPDPAAVQALLDKYK